MPGTYHPNSPPRRTRTQANTNENARTHTNTHSHRVNTRSFFPHRHTTVTTVPRRPVRPLWRPPHPGPIRALAAGASCTLPSSWWRRRAARRGGDQEEEEDEEEEQEAAGRTSRQEREEVSRVHSAQRGQTDSRSSDVAFPPAGVSVTGAAPSPAWYGSPGGEPRPRDGNEPTI